MIYYCYKSLNQINKKGHKNMENNIVSNQLIEKIESLLLLAREKVAVQVNSTLLLTYMEIGKTIVEEQNLHKDDPDYNNKSITELSKILTKKFGK